MVICKTKGFQYFIAVSHFVALEKLGFSHLDCERALIASQGNMNEAALWLTHNATLVPEKPEGPNKQGLNIAGIEVCLFCQK